MFKSRSRLSGWMVIFFLLGIGVLSSACSVGPFVAYADDAAHPLPPVATVSAGEPLLQVSLSSAESSLSWDSRLAAPQPFDLPVVFLHNQGQAVPEKGRTLFIRIAGLTGGIPVQIQALSWHENRSVWEQPLEMLPPDGSLSSCGDEGRSTWERHLETQRVLLPDRPCTDAEPCVVEWVLDATTMLSDLYRLTLLDGSGSLLWQNPNPEQPDFAALDTWQIGIDGHLVRILYATLFPFARGENDLDNRLSPQDVHDFIANQAVPIVVESWRTQFGDWGFGPIHPEWDADGVVEIVLTTPPFALFDGTGTYTVSTYADGRPYPERRIWMFTSHNTFQAYDTLANGFKVIFAHEFFHMAQWNVLLASGYPAQRWLNVFVEAQAMAATSVQYPELELSKAHLVYANSQYGGTAAHFLAQRLETSYADFEAERASLYDAALYWRFLYEQAGGEMHVLRAALEEMARQYQPDIVSALGGVMDAALARAGSPSRTFADSLVAFAGANFALRLQNGRCEALDGSGCLNKHVDPDHLYPDPPLAAEIAYGGAEVAYRGSIPASYGTDLIEVTLSPVLVGRPINIALHSQGARFAVQVWKLGDQEGEKPVALTAQPEPMVDQGDGHYTFSIASLDPAVNRLVVIVTRLDAHERADPVGAYTIVLGPE
ncbi:MAG: hypothetical protein JXM73_26360 [Anaerolineae bacterium]|nr:hypothetical protein [Anaerolineae bacterium]